MIKNVASISSPPPRLNKNGNFLVQNIPYLKYFIATDFVCFLSLSIKPVLYRNHIKIKSNNPKFKNSKFGGSIFLSYANDRKYFSLMTMQTFEKIKNYLKYLLPDHKKSGLNQSSSDQTNQANIARRQIY